MDSSSDSFGYQEISTTKTKSQEPAHLRLFVTSADPQKKFVMGCKSQDTILALQNIVANQYFYLFTEKEDKKLKMERENDLYKINPEADSVRISLNGFYLPPYAKISYLLHDGDTIHAHFGEPHQPKQVKEKEKEMELEVEKSEQSEKKNEKESKKKKTKKESVASATPKKRGRPRKNVKKDNDDNTNSGGENDEKLRALLSPEVANRNNNDKVDLILGSITTKKVKKSSERQDPKPQLKNKPATTQNKSKGGARQISSESSREEEFEIIPPKKSEPIKDSTALNQKPSIAGLFDGWETFTQMNKPTAQQSKQKPKQNDSSSSSEEEVPKPKKSESIFDRHRAGFRQTNETVNNDSGFTGLFGNGLGARQQFGGGFERPSLFKPPAGRLGGLFNNWGEDHWGGANLEEHDWEGPPRSWDGWNGDRQIFKPAQVKPVVTKLIIAPNKRKSLEDDSDSDIDSKIIPMQSNGRVSSRFVSKLAGPSIPEPISFDQTISKLSVRKEGSNNSKQNAETGKEQNQHSEPARSNAPTTNVTNSQTKANPAAEESKSNTQRSNPQEFRKMPTNRSESMESEIEWLQRKPQRPKLVKKKTSDVSDTSSD